MSDKIQKNVGLAMIGTGFASTFHMENYKRVYGVSVQFVGNYSRNIDKAKVFAKEHGFEKTYESLDDLLNDTSVNLVDVCVPNAFHEEFVIKVLNAGKHVVIEKPFTGAFIPPTKREDGWAKNLEEALASANRMISTEKSSGFKIMYAENWVYAPGVQKAKRLLATSNSSILRMIGEESHSGTHSKYAMDWKTSGGGSLYNKGCHLLGGALYLKYQEGLRKFGKEIRPSWVVAASANLTESAAFTSDSDHYIRTGWKDSEDWGTMIVGFNDGSVAQIMGADTVLGGIQNHLTVFGTKATIKININPNDAVLAYAPDATSFSGEYIREKVETTAGWQYTNPDEAWMNGFPNEMQDFAESVVENRAPLSGSFLGWDVVSTSYSAYLSIGSGKKVNIPIN